MRVPVPGKDHIRLEVRNDKDATEADIVFIVTPLTFKQRAEVNGEIQKVAGQMVRNSFEMAGLAVKYALKGIEGLMDGSGTPYKLEFDKNEMVTDECLDFLVSIPDHGGTLFNACTSLSAEGVYTKLTDNNGKIIEGVKVLLPGDEEKN